MFKVNLLCVLVLSSGCVLTAQEPLQYQRNTGGLITTPTLAQDLRLVNNVSITAVSGTTTITSATANFTRADNSRIAIINPKNALYVVAIGAGSPTGWNPNDRCAVAGGTGGQVVVLTTSAGGVPATVETIASGAGYATAKNVTCTAISPSTGTGLTININRINLGARSYTGGLTFVNSTTATLNLPYSGANTTDASMMIGTDDGPAFNALVATIPRGSARGQLSLGCKPFITTVTLELGASRNTQIEGCGMASGITTGAAPGAAIGTTIIWAGASHPVTLSAASGHTVTLTDTAGHNFYKPSNCASSIRQCFVDIQGATQSGMNGQHLILSVPTTTQLTFYAANTSLTSDSGYIPVNDIIRLNSETGTTIRNLNIQGSDQPSTFPRACVDFTDGSGSTTNGLNRTENVFCGNLGEQGFNVPGNRFGTTSTAQFFILADPIEEVNDRNQFENVHAYNVDACFAAEHQQPTDWTFTGNNGCIFSGVAVLIPDGVWWHFSGTLQVLQNGVNFIIGNNAHLDIAKQTEETDGPAFISSPQLGGPGDVAGTTMMAEFISPSGTGLPGGTLSIDHGVYPASSALPSNGDFVWTSLGSSSSLILNDFTLEYDIQAPSVVTPLVDFSVTAGGQRNVFECHGCSGFQGKNFNVTSTGYPVQMTVVCNDSPAGPGLGESGCNWLQQGDAAGVDDFRIDFAGKLRVLGAKVMIPQLAVPTAPVNPTCAVSGATNYYYRYTAVSGGLETTPSREYTASRCASSVSSKNYISGVVWPVVGADSYKIYRGTSSGGELYAFTLQANTGWNTSTAPTGGTPFAFRDTVATPSGALPTVNSTGEAQLVYILPVLSTVTLGKVCPVNGVIWLGVDGTTGICESGVLVAWPVAQAPTSNSSYTVGSSAGSGASAPTCYVSGFAPCSVQSGIITWTTTAGATTGIQGKVNYPAQSNALRCQVTAWGNATAALGLNAEGVSNGQWEYLAANIPAVGTYYLSYHCDSK